MDQLRYSEDLKKHVMASAHPVQTRFRLVRVAAIIAVLCMLFGCAAAANGWIRSEVSTKDMGKLTLDLANAEFFQFSSGQGVEGISMYYMPIGRCSISCGGGVIYEPASGFYRVTEDFELVPLEHKTVSLELQKKDKTYSLELAYVVMDGQIVSNQGTYTVTRGEVLLNLISADQWHWPVYLNVSTGEFRDAMPKLDQDSFDLDVSHIRPLRDGFLVATMDTRSPAINKSSTRYLYWVSGDCSEVRRLDVPENNVYETVVGDTLYYRDGSGRYYYMDKSFGFHPVEEVNRTEGVAINGLVAFRGDDGNLEIADLTNRAVYSVTDMAVAYSDVSMSLAYFATRNSADGSIVICRLNYTMLSLTNIELAVLDRDSGQLQYLTVNGDYTLWGLGWLDDHRLWVTYTDGIQTYLCVYVFGQ